MKDGEWGEKRKRGKSNKKKRRRNLMLLENIEGRGYFHQVYMAKMRRQCNRSSTIEDPGEQLNREDMKYFSVPWRHFDISMKFIFVVYRSVNVISHTLQWENCLTSLTQIFSSQKNIRLTKIIPLPYGLAKKGTVVKRWCKHKYFR